MLEQLLGARLLELAQLKKEYIELLVEHSSYTVTKERVAALQVRIGAIVEKMDRLHGDIAVIRDSMYIAA